jgi:hypothetical protein
MHYRTTPAVAASLLLAVIGLTRVSRLEAQATSAALSTASATRLQALTGLRAQRWAAASPVIHCGPAPLTERPGSAGELARPRVAPLEEAFLDASIVRRTFAAGTQPSPRLLR